MPRADAEPRPLRLIVTVSRLPKEGLPVRFEAGNVERAALARQLGIPAIESLSAEIVAAPWHRGGVRVAGQVVADVVQTDVVTLEPLSQRVAEPVELFFVPAGSRIARRGEAGGAELDLDPDGPEMPEVFSGDRIDVGPLLAEILALGLDPYPRSEGVTFAEADEGDAGAEDASPFAALRDARPTGR